MGCLQGPHNGNSYRVKLIRYMGVGIILTIYRRVGCLLHNVGGTYLLRYYEVITRTLRSFLRFFQGYTTKGFGTSFGLIYIYCKRGTYGSKRVCTFCGTIFLGTRGGVVIGGRLHYWGVGSTIGLFFGIICVFGSIYTFKIGFEVTHNTRTGVAITFSFTRGLTYIIGVLITQGFGTIQGISSRHGGVFGSYHLPFVWGVVGLVFY